MSDPALVPDTDLVRRVHDTEAAYTASRIGILARLPGNPVGCAVRDLGDGGRAMQARHIPNANFNRLTGLGEAHAPHLAEHIAPYRAQNIAVAAEVIPGLTPEAVTQALAAEGFGHVRFHTTLTALPRKAPQTAPGVTVERVTAPTLEEFLDCHCRGWAIPDAGGFKNNTRGWLTEPGWNLFLARVYDQPAATAILYVRDGLGYCADSACDPEYRGRGAHAALLGRRLEEAGAQGCEIVCAMADFLSTSQRNMIRAGFSTLHTKSVWMARP